MRRAFCAVAFIAFWVLLPRAAWRGIAGDYVDPISRLTSQDEALYASSAIHMATRGDWLTPHFMGRLALYKPPLLYWCAGISAKVFGVARLPLRLPIVLLAALAAGLVFLWAAEVHGWQAGVAAVLLLLSNHLWDTLGAICMTDGLLVACVVAAAYVVFSDPWLGSRGALAAFAAAVAAGVLTKGIAGVLPLGVLVLYWLVAPRKYRPRLARVCAAGALALAMAAPWFVYQAAVHPKWFWTEHVGIEILGYGGGAPPQTSNESQAVFYLARLAILDPVLVAIAVAAVPAFFDELRRRSHGATLLGCWIAIAVASVIAWQYRNASYLLPLVPGLAILGAAYSPFLQRRYARWMIAFLVAAVVVKWAQPAAPWGLAYQSGSVQPLAASLANYCEKGRGNPLIIVDFADDLYATVLPLERLRYATVNASAYDARYGMPFQEMRIAVTVEQFNRLRELEPEFRDRLRRWGMNSPDPIATLIYVRNDDELGALVRAHGEADFAIPARYWDAVRQSPHTVSWTSRQDYFFLLSQQPKNRTAARRWTCQM
jgi:4-amino-4-deoxy-L-arabinose transferase-like glycosyltransferase